MADGGRGPLSVSMQRADIPPTASQALWTLIRQSTNALSFQNYQAFMEQVLCGDTAGRGQHPALSGCPWPRDGSAVSCRGGFPSRGSSRTGS